MDARWVAVLSNGETAVEHSGNWEIIPGERKPWVRLCAYATDNDLFLNSLAIEFGGRVYNMPDVNSKRFDLSGGNPIPPLYYSVSYIIEAEMGDIGFSDEKMFIDVTSHYRGFEIHFICGLGSELSWITVTDGSTPLVVSPKNETA